ncbi:MAG: insulinase family protein [Clostridiales Family XIII bacterium]|jgi:predicted Zn-dependent peptidase|nr:insulinase family protein [Clostridiales Family XIII bacterium]
MITEERFENGITVALEELPHAESASLGVWVRAGAVDEVQPGGAGKTNAGISHFVEHMMFKGTQRRTYKDIADHVDRIGAAANAFTSKEATCYYIKLQPQHFAPAIDILADMVKNSLFDPGEMEKEKQVIYEEMKMIEDVPEDYGNELVDEAVFSGGSFGHSVIGTPDTVGGITRDDILAYRAQRYTADNILLSVAGKFDRAAVLALLAEAFGDIPAAEGSARALTVAPAPTADIRKDKGNAQSHLFLGRRSVSRLDDDCYPYQLYSSILGGSMSSRLFQNVREEKGLAYSVYSHNASLSADGMFLIYAGVAHEKEAAAEAAIFEELTRLAEVPVDAEELAKVKEQNKGAYLFARENIVGRMSSLGRNKLLLGRIIPTEEVMASIDAVTAADIQRIAKQNAIRDSFTRVIVC